MKKALSMILVICLLFSCICVFGDENVFEDVPDTHWAYNEIQYFYNQNIVNGVSEKCFAPDEYVTREQFAKILANTFDKTINETNTQSFSDVTTDMWSYNYIEAVKEYLPGYNTDDSEQLFNPTAKALREDIAYALVKIKNMYNGEYDENVLSQFSDNLDISNDLKPYVATAVESGLIKGYTDGTLKPREGITRAEAVTLLFRAINFTAATPDPTPKLEMPTVTPTPTTTPSSKADYIEYESANILQMSGFMQFTECELEGKVYAKWSEEKQDATFYATVNCNSGGKLYGSCDIDLIELISCTEDKIEGYFRVVIINGVTVQPRVKGVVVIEEDTIKLNTDATDYNLIASLN